MRNYGQRTLKLFFCCFNMPPFWHLSLPKAFKIFVRCCVIVQQLWLLLAVKKKKKDLLGEPLGLCYSEPGGIFVLVNFVQSNGPIFWLFFFLTWKSHHSFGISCTLQVKILGPKRWLWPMTDTICTVTPEQITGNELVTSLLHK